jgi:hypothetical protein
VDAIREVQNLIPAWQLDRQLLYVPYAALITLVVCFWAAAALASPARKLPNTLHWTERARLVFPARQAMLRLALFCPILAGAMAAIYAGPLSRWSAMRLGLVAGAAAALAAAIPTHFLLREASSSRISARNWLRSVACFWLLVWPNWGVVFVAGAFLPVDSRMAPLAAIAVAAPVFLWLRLGGAVWLARRLGLAWPARAEVVAAMDRAAAAAGVRKPLVLEIIWASPNILVWQAPPSVLVTEAAASTLTGEQLQAVTTGPLRVLGERDLIRGTRIALAFAPLLFVNAKYILIQVFPLGPLLSVSVFACLWWAGSLALKRWGASREPEPGAAAQVALAAERAYEIGLWPVVTSNDPNKRSPDLFDRLVAAGITPSYPRPEPPVARGFTPIEQIATLAVALLVPALLLGPQHLTEPELLAHAAIRADPWDFENLARISVEASRWDRAELYLRADSEVDRKSPFPLAQLARVRAAQGHCREAEQALAEAEERNTRYHAYADAQRAITRARREVPGCAPAGEAPGGGAPKRPAGTYSQR